MEIMFELFYIVLKNCHVIEIYREMEGTNIGNNIVEMNQRLRSVPGIALRGDLWFLSGVNKDTAHIVKLVVQQRPGKQIRQRRNSIATDLFRQGPRANNWQTQETYNHTQANRKLGSGPADRSRSTRQTRWSRSPNRENRDRSPPFQTRGRSPPFQTRDRSPPFQSRDRSPPNQRRGRSPPIQNRSATTRGRPSLPNRSPASGKDFRSRSPPRDRSPIRSRSPLRDRSSNDFRSAGTRDVPPAGRPAPVVYNNDRWWIPDNDEEPNNDSETNNGSAI